MSHGQPDYRTKGPAYFGRLIRRPHVLTSDELVALLEDAREHGVFSDAEVQELYDADLVVRGRRAADGTEVYLVVGVSWGVGPYSVSLRSALAQLCQGRTFPDVEALLDAGVEAVYVCTPNALHTEVVRLPL